MCVSVEGVQNIGFVSTRFAGTEGVPVETAKWADVFEKEGLSCFYFAGEIDRPADISYLLEEAHFRHPEVRHIFKNCFGVNFRPRSLTKKIHEIKEHIKDHLYKFIKKFKIELLIAENSLTIPLNIPLGLAITELLSETGISAIAHHHDFFWERQEFKTNAIWEYLNMAFPPHLPTIRHVVINSAASNQLSLRTGISSSIIPTVMDFENPPLRPNGYTSDVRKALGIESDELFVLQPTRVIKRKGIEHAIELVSRLKMKAKLVISHASGDEKNDYERRVREYSKLLNVNTVFVSDIINEYRRSSEDGRKIYTLNDIYPYADLVTYPSNFEGFGNAFLEAVYYRKPILVNTYSIYRIDIQPKGFSAIEIDGYVTEKAVRQAREVLQNSELRENMVNENYKIAKQYYSYSVLHKKLMNLLMR
ncbi:glycosyltransferase family 4 protein [Desulfonema magnum]|uniref:Glycosyltransferase family I N-terminal domain-containing protein n=1 Tax=Desulfonema magnum TaxID=45655 RepID=A0A975GS23_9BACT|nr:glycosyltransferase family 4 protein [Desulfonema magnum]QTA90643.1 Glycosyltransferase family I N-terminal domain-containing protein [Desulfonema magnum]